MDLDAEDFAALDGEGMLSRIEELPQQCRSAWQLSRGLVLPDEYSQVRQVVLLGMGGSAIGGALLQELVAGECRVPVTVVRGYNLPEFVRGPGVLVIACSYSGNTEETLTAFEEALGRGVLPAVVTTGGKLAALAQERTVPAVYFNYKAQPRAALGYSFILLLGMFSRLGLVRDYAADVEEAVRVMSDRQVEIGPAVPTESNAAKSLALRLADKLPVVYGAGFLAPVANRWKTQFNENSKHWAFFEVLPELNHNAVVGLSMPESVRERVLVLMLRSSRDHPRVQARWDVTAELLRQERVAWETVWAQGESPLSQMLSLILFNDYVSFYLAMVNGVDPSPVETISYLKRRLAEIRTGGD